jgi:hypothetical protein
MATYQDRDGVWMLYDYDAIPYLIQLYVDVVPAARQAAIQSFGRVGFLPFDMTFQDAVRWWELIDRPVEDIQLPKYSLRPDTVQMVRHEINQWLGDKVGISTSGTEDLAERLVNMITGEEP